ncbi:MAG: M48 family metallopeptidase [Planctomycetota bacterium]
MAVSAGLPVPRVFIIDDTAPNAFATGRNPKSASVAVTRGLLAKLTRDELQGVIAHEMSHVQNRDILYATLTAVLLGLIALMCDFFLRGVFRGRAIGGRGRGRRAVGGGQGIFLLIGLVLALIAPLVAKLIQLATSREREYLADSSAALLTRYPDGLASALEKIASDREVLEVANRATQHLYIVNPIKPFEARASAMWSTHPPIAERVRRLREMK